MTNIELYRDITPISARLRDRRLRFSGHCWRSKSEIISQMLFWEPSKGKRTRGRPAMTYIDQLEKDTCLPRQELPKIMENRTEWKKLVKSVRVVVFLRCLKNVNPISKNFVIKTLHFVTFT